MGHVCSGSHSSRSGRTHHRSEQWTTEIQRTRGSEPERRGCQQWGHPRSSHRGGPSNPSATLTKPHENYLPPSAHLKFHPFVTLLRRSDCIRKCGSWGFVTLPRLSGEGCPILQLGHCTRAALL